MKSIPSIKIDRAVIVGVLFFGVLMFLSVKLVFATTNISSGGTQHWAWNDAIGWLDFYGDNSVNVANTVLTGNVTSALGNISLNCAGTADNCATSDYKVYNTNGTLSGWAWNDIIGWISFCGGAATSTCPGGTSYHVQIDPATGHFDQWAWNDVIGWISFCGGSGTSNCPGAVTYDVETSWIATSSAAYFESTTFDTGVARGAQLNSFVWRGTLGGDSWVDFQFAVSNSSSGPWSYSTIYSPYFDTITTFDKSAYNNYRYFRYKATLHSNTSQTISPVINDVIVNWSP